MLRIFNFLHIEQVDNSLWSWWCFIFQRLHQQMMSELEEKEKISSTRSLDKMEGYDPEEMIEMSSGIKQVGK